MVRHAFCPLIRPGVAPRLQNAAMVRQAHHEGFSGLTLSPSDPTLGFSDLALSFSNLIRTLQPHPELVEG